MTVNGFHYRLMFIMQPMQLKNVWPALTMLEIVPVFRGGIMVGTKVIAHLRDTSCN